MPAPRTKEEEKETTIGEEEEYQEAGPAVEEKQPLFQKILLFLLNNLLYLVITAVVSGFVAFTIVSLVGRNVKATYEEEGIIPKQKPLAYFDLGEFNVLSADRDEPAFIKVGIALAYDKDNKKLLTELNEKKPEIKDTINTILSSKKQEDIDTPEEREILKEEIRKVLNQRILVYGEIEKVLFTTALTIYSAR